MAKKRRVASCTWKVNFTNRDRVLTAAGSKDESLEQVKKFLEENAHDEEFWGTFVDITFMYSTYY